jgi:protein-S-isoprenylcysteine O-methyltransferase Ste14
MDIFVYGFNAILLLVAAWAVFRYVGEDYGKHGRLRPISTFLEISIFFLHGVLSYVYLDSDPAHVRWPSATAIFAIFSMAVGLLLVFISMRKLSWGRSSGRVVDQLSQGGLYRYSRNPQIVSYGLFLSGYALLWPSFPGLLWLVLYSGIAHMMVSTEEKHLRRVFGEAYVDYCARTPRYIGLRK